MVLDRAAGNQMRVDTSQYDAVIVGLGKTGLSCARFLARLGKHVAITDASEQPPCLQELQKEFPNIFCSLGGIDLELLADTEEIIVSPGVSVTKNCIDKINGGSNAVIGDIELFCRYANAPVIAITGSNGKSTVTTLIEKITENAGLNVRVGGNLGTPALDLLDEQSPDYYILELSSFQLEITYSLNAHVGVILNISEDHMDRYSNFNAYANAKKKIFDGNGVMIINADDAIVSEMVKLNRHIVRYSVNSKLDSGFYIGNKNGEEFLCKNNEPLMRKSDLSIKGAHNASNILAAMAIADIIGISFSRIKPILTDFSGLPHRCELVDVVNGVEWYNDSKATNVGACCAAIKGLANKKEIILIAGGDGKNANFSELSNVAKDYVSNAILFGKDAQVIAEHIRGFIPVHMVNDMREAVFSASRIAKFDDKVLLSPACSSLDMFNNYQERGEAFINEVKALG